MTDLVERLRADIGKRDIYRSDRTLEEAATALEAKDKELAALKSWIDLHRGDTMSLSNEVDHFRAELAEAEDRAETAERERDEARAALKPFAAVAADYIERGLDDDNNILAGRTVWRTDEGTAPPNVRFAHFRAARAITGED